MKARPAYLRFQSHCNRSSSGLSIFALPRFPIGKLNIINSLDVYYDGTISRRLQQCCDLSYLLSIYHQQQQQQRAASSKHVEMFTIANCMQMSCSKDHHDPIPISVKRQQRKKCSKEFPALQQQSNVKITELNVPKDEDNN